MGLGTPRKTKLSVLPYQHKLLLDSAVWVFFPSVCCCNQEIFFSYRYQPSHSCLSPLPRPMIPHTRESSPPESLPKTNTGVDPKNEKEKKPHRPRNGSRTN